MINQEYIVINQKEVNTCVHCFCTYLLFRKYSIYDTIHIHLAFMVRYVQDILTITLDKNNVTSDQDN